MSLNGYSGRNSITHIWTRFRIAPQWFNSSDYSESFIDKWVVWAAVFCGLFK